MLFLGNEHYSLGFKLFLLYFLFKCVVNLNLKQTYETENICENIVCEPLLKVCTDGQIKVKIGYQGCCDACVNKTDNVRSKCQNDKDIRQNILKENDEYADNLWIPDCENSGDYKLRQIKTKKTVCMKSDGTKLFGQDISEMSQNMSCSCSLFKHNLRGKDNYMLELQEHCTSAGDFEKIQCIGNLCYCSNTETGKVEGRMVRMGHIDKLPCYNKKKPMKSYLTPCEKELVRARRLRYQFLQKGIKVSGLETVECDPDGTFSPTQCDSSRCSCTDEKGVQIRSYFTDELFRYNQMGCDCARDNEKAAAYAQYPALKCDKYGNYNFTQCVHHANCFCVDEDGDVISKELNGTTCNELLNKLSDKDILIITTTKETTIDDYDYSEER